MKIIYILTLITMMSCNPKYMIRKKTPCRTYYNVPRPHRGSNVCPYEKHKYKDYYVVDSDLIEKR